MSVKASPGGSNLSSWASPSLGNMPPAGRPKTLSGSEPGTAKRTSSPTSQTSPVATKVAKTTKTGSGKRLACDNCRERKVRCNREQPVCGRCSRLGHGCRYTTPAKHNASQTDVSQLLLTLHSRLAQTEARLAINPPLPDPNQGAMNPPFLDSNRGIGCNPMIPGGLDIPNMDFIDPRQQFPRPGMNFLDSMNMDEHMLQSDFDAW